MEKKHKYFCVRFVSFIVVVVFHIFPPNPNVVFVNLGGNVFTSNEYECVCMKRNQ